MFEGAYALVANGKIGSAVFLIFDAGDRAFTEGRFADVDTAFDKVDLDRLDSNTWISLLVVGHWARPHLRRRMALVARVERKLLETEPIERVERLLRGLR